MLTIIGMKPRGILIALVGMAAAQP